MGEVIPMPPPKETAKRPEEIRAGDIVWDSEYGFEAAGVRHFELDSVPVVEMLSSSGDFWRVRGANGRRITVLRDLGVLREKLHALRSEEY